MRGEARGGGVLGKVGEPFGAWREEKCEVWGGCVDCYTNCNYNFIVIIIIKKIFMERENMTININSKLIHMYYKVI